MASFIMVVTGTIAVVALSVSILASAIDNKEMQVFAASDDNRWYVGSANIENLFVYYRIEHRQINDSRPFAIEIYFKQQDGNSNWITPITIIDAGKVFTDTLLLNGSNLSVLQQNQTISEEIAPYIDGYNKTIRWLGSYALKPGLPLSASSWNISDEENSVDNATAIGYKSSAQVFLFGTEKLSVPAGHFASATVLSHNSTIVWITSDFPYPIKGISFVEDRNHFQETEYEFDLLEFGHGEPHRVVS